MSYAVVISPAARRDLKRITGTDRRRVANAIDDLSVDPRPQGCKKLRGAEDVYRVRVGDYRIVYQIEDDRLVVLIVRVGRRNDIYGKRRP